MASTERFTSYPAYRESGVEWLGEIPAHWLCLSMARVTRSRCDGPFGSGLKSQHYSVDGVRVIRLQNIGGPEFLNSDQVFVDERHADVLGDHSVLQGDLLIAGLGDDAHPVGRACVAPEGLDRAMVKADCFRFRLDPEKIVPEFAAYQLSANALAASGFLATGSTRSRMNLSTTAARKIALPPVAEQHAVVAFLNCETAKIDALVTKKERLIELLQEQHTALITSAVTKGLNHDVRVKESGTKWLGEIPAHWCCLALGRVTLSRCDGPFGSGIKSQHYSADGVRVVRLQNIGAANFVNLDQAFVSEVHAEALGDHSVFEGDLLIAGLGDDARPVGRACVAPAGLGKAIVKADCFRFRLDQRRAIPRFAAYQLSASAVSASGFFVTGSTRLRTNLTMTTAKKIALPPISEQRSIVDYLDREMGKFDAMTVKLGEAINRLKELRNALISAAVTGKFNVREAVP